MGIHVHARIAAMATATAAALAGPLLMAAPAAAAPTPTVLLTEASCTAGGGTFTQVKRLKTCTTLISSEVLYVDTGYARWDGPWMARFDVEVSESLMLVETQSGKKPIVSTYKTSYTYTPMLEGRSCTENVNGFEEPRDVADCEAWGLYAPM